MVKQVKEFYTLKTLNEFLAETPTDEIAKITPILLKENIVRFYVECFVENAG